MNGNMPAHTHRLATFLPFPSVISSLPRPSRYRATLAVRTQTDCSENEPACTSSIGDSVQNLPSSDAAIGGLETSMIVDGTEPVIQNDRQKWVSDGDAEGKTRILIDRLLALFDLTEGEVRRTLCLLGKHAVTRPVRGLLSAR